MKKITSFNDVVSGDGFDVDSIATVSVATVNNFLAPVQVIPAEDISNGQFCLMFLRDPPSAEHCFRHQMFDAPAEVVHENFATFKTTLERLLAADLPVFKADAPKLLRLGFLVLKNSGNEWHMVRLLSYKQWKDDEYKRGIENE